MNTSSQLKIRPFILGVAGGSGSGKTYFAQHLVQELGSELCEIVYQDNFYIDQSARFDFDGGSVNFDHPDALDFKLMAKCLQQLRNGEDTQIPQYDFKSHKRLPQTILIPAKPVIVVDGILILHPPVVRSLFDETIFFATPEQLRFQRRLNRDVKERGRTPDGVKSQFEKQVKPMHDLFVEPSKIHANTIVMDVGEFRTVLGDFTQRLSQRP